MAYLAVKAKGDSSMPLKRETPEDAYGRNAPRDLRDMAKAILLEPQSPAMRTSSLDTASIGRGHQLSKWRIHDTWILSTDGQRETNRVRERKGCLNRADEFPMCKREIAYGVRALWQRSLRSSLRTGKPSTWQREAGVLGAKTRRYAKCRQPK